MLGTTIEGEDMDLSGNNNKSFKQQHSISRDKKKTDLTAFLLHIQLLQSYSLTFDILLNIISHRSVDVFHR